MEPAYLVHLLEQVRELLRELEQHQCQQHGEKTPQLRLEVDRAIGALRS